MGSVVGSAVASSVGSAVGSSVGSIVGSAVASSVGSIVGSAVASSVGAGVISAETFTYASPPHRLHPARFCSTASARAISRHCPANPSHSSEVWHTSFSSTQMFGIFSVTNLSSGASQVPQALNPAFTLSARVYASALDMPLQVDAM